MPLKLSSKSSKSEYCKRNYSGGVSRKKVAAQLKRCHGPEHKSRKSIWGQNQPQESSHTISEPPPTQESEHISAPRKRKNYDIPDTDFQTKITRTYERQKPGFRIEEMYATLPPPTYPELNQKPEQNAPCKRKNDDIPDPDFQPKLMRTYTRQKPAFRLEATYTTPPPPTHPTPTTNCSLEINWPQRDQAVEDHQLEVEVVQTDWLSALSGNRVVDIKYVLNWAFEIERHKNTCTGAIIEYVSEQRQGLRSTFVFKCLMCGKLWRKCTEETEKINKSFVWGTVTSGGFYTQAEHLINIMDIPCMTAPTFQKIEKHLGDVWLQHLTEEIEQAGKKERAIAIEKGNIDDDGVPFVTVCVDGGWPKRTYGHNYNSASGMACIIGQETQQCLFLGVKNKYCFFCQHHERLQQDVPPHKCFKNFDGPSTAMEASILVEGFQKSEEMHGLRYLAFVGDGDSSVFAQLKENVSYGKRIKKFECKNHVVKNYTNALHKILGNTKLPLAGRNLLRKKLVKLTKVTRKIIIHQEKDPKAMRADLNNSPNHVFGKHDSCLDYYCKYSPTASTNSDDQKDEDLTEKIKGSTTVWALIVAANEAVMSKAGRLSSQTTNVAENLMSVINKFNCGKRINLCKGGSYQRRVHIAGLQHGSGYKWHKKAWKKTSTQSPGKNFSSYISRKEKSRIRQKSYTRRRIFVPNQKPKNADKHYGPNAVDPIEEVSASDLKQMCAEKLLEYNKTDDEIRDIELATIGQHDNEIYEVHRNDRLTASQFGMICKRRSTTPCHNHVKQILYKSSFSNKDTLYGTQNESVARTIFAESYKKTVRHAGLFIDREYGFLGASPDGVIENEDALLEIKCFPSLARTAKTMESAAKEKKDFPLHLTSDNVLEMNKKHNYYYQIQGQLRVTNKRYCYFVGFITPLHPLTVIKVPRDETFISKMIPLLVNFFQKCILPEVILRRVPKQAKCLEPVLEKTETE